MSDPLRWLKNPNAPKSVFGDGESDDQRAARLADDEARRAENFARAQKGSFGGAASQVPGLAQTPAPAAQPPQDGGMSIDPALVSEQARMNITPVSTPAPQPQQQQQSSQTGGMAIPMVEHTQTSDSFTKDDPTATRELDKARTDYQKSVIEGAAAGAQKAAMLNTIAEERDRHAKETEQRDAAEQVAQQKRVNDAMFAQRQMLDDLGKAKKDPDRFWKQRGTGAQIAAAIAMGFGAFGAAMTGSRNSALDIINSAIDRDLDAQESEIQIKRDKVNTQSNVIAQLRQQGADDLQARSIARQHYLEDTARRIETKGASFAGVEGEQAATEKAAALRQMAAEEDARRKAHTIQVAKSKQPAFSAADLSKLSEDERKRYVPDAGGMALTDDDAKVLKAYGAAHSSVVGDIQRLKELVDEHGNESFGTAKAKMLQLKNRIVTAMNKEAGLGAMSGSDRELIEGQLADPTAFFARGVKTSALLGNLLQTFADAKLHTYQAYGIAAK